MKTRTRAMKVGLGALVLWAWAAAQAVAPVITNITMVGSTPRFSIHSDVGITNQIQFLADLRQTNWTALTNLLVAESPYGFVDADASPATSRFYRVVAILPTINPAPTNMVTIPGGAFTMGDAFGGEGYGDELPLHTNYVSAFYMDKYEVTKALWDEVYEWATNHGYSFEYGAAGKESSHPAHSMTWYDCVKWCNARSEKEQLTPAYYTSLEQTNVYRSGPTNVQNDWVKWNTGYRLPTEAEWEKAARGGAGEHRFPWADTDNITHDWANYFSDSSYDYDTSETRDFHPTFAVDGTPYTSPAGYFDPNGYGLYDMAGNVREWCWDWYSDTYYSESPDTDPRGATSGSERVARGGGWYDDAFGCRAAIRYSELSPSLHGNINLGFRCVLPPSQ